jgi:hypothetical protein
MEQNNRSKCELTDFEKIQTLLHFRDAHRQFKENEERQSEQRIRFFLTLSTGTVAVIGLFLRGNILSDSTFTFDPTLTFLVALFILFWYGILTFARVIWDRRAVRRHDMIISNVGKAIAKLNPDLIKEINQQDYEDEENKNWLAKKIKGTLSQFMYVTECLLAVGFVITLGIKYDWPVLYIIAISLILPLIVFVFLFKWSEYIKKGIEGPKN